MTDAELSDLRNFVASCHHAGLCDWFGCGTVRRLVEEVDRLKAELAAAKCRERPPKCKVEQALEDFNASLGPTEFIPHEARE